MTSFATWLEAARPKTIVASLSPVAIGAVAAAFHGDFSLNLLLWITLAAVTFQVSANYANDYFDFVQGNDTEKRKGFRRATASGLVTATEMKRAMIITLAISAALSIYLVAIGGLPIALIALLFLACSLFYSVGKKSLAARGLGELTSSSFSVSLASMSPTTSSPKRFRLSRFSFRGSQAFSPRT